MFLCFNYEWQVGLLMGFFGIEFAKILFFITCFQLPFYTKVFQQTSLTM